MRNPGRTGHRWRQTRAAILAHATHCAICGEPLEPNAPPRSSRSTSVDHIIPLSQGGSPLDPANCRATHYGCNSKRQAPPRTWTSRDW